MPLPAEAIRSDWHPPATIIERVGGMLARWSVAVDILVVLILVAALAG